MFFPLGKKEKLSMQNCSGSSNMGRENAVAAVATGGKFERQFCNGKIAHCFLEGMNRETIGSRKIIFCKIIVIAEVSRDDSNEF